MNGIYLTLRDLYSLDNFDSISSEEVGVRTGFNLGNFAFRLGLSRILNLDKYQKCNFNDIHEMASVYEEMIINCNRPTVISCANWLGNNERSELPNKTRYEALKKIDSKMAPFAIGAQNSNRESVFKLRKYSLSLMSLLSERSESISVRDTYTKNVLEHNGIYNTIVTGCPSNFINYNNNLGDAIKRKCNSLLDQDFRYLKHHICEYSQGHAHSQGILLNTARFLSNNVSSYIIQSPDLLSFSMNENSTIPEHYQRAFRFRKSILKQKVMHFTNALTWMDYSRGFDLSWGMRLHGNILPMQATVPSLVITHDSRTEGLSDTMGLPNVGIDRFVSYKPKEYTKVILNLISEQVEQYDVKRCNLHAKFIKFISDNGLEARHEFLGMFND